MECEIRVLSTGEAGGKLLPQTVQLPPLKGLPVIYIITQDLKFKSQNACVYQQELKFEPF